MPHKKKISFLLLLAKNVLIEIRHPIRASITLIVPVILLISNGCLKHLTPVTSGSEHYFEPFCVFKVNTCSDTSIEMFKDYDLIYSPLRNTKIEEIMTNGFKKHFKNVVGFENQLKMKAYVMTSQNDTIFSAMSFDDVLINQENLPDDIVVTFHFPGYLRKDKKRTWKTGVLYNPTIFVEEPRHPNSNTGRDPNYYEEGFLFLQHALVFYLMGRLAKHMPLIELQRFPIPKWTFDEFLSYRYLFVFQCIVSYLLPFVCLTKDLTEERKFKLKGIPNRLHWLAWFFKSFTVFLIITAIIILYVSVPFGGTAICRYSDVSVVVVFFLLYSCSLIALAFFISALASSSFLAYVISFVTHCVSNMPYSWLEPTFLKKSLSGKILICFLPNSALSFGLKIFKQYEQRGDGLTWSKLFTPTMPSDDMKFVYIIIMLLVDTVVFFLLALYVDLVAPDEYREPIPWYLFKRKHKIEPAKIVKYLTRKSQDNQVEGYFNQSEVGIKLANLTKLTGTYPIVKDMNLLMYKGQITALLGRIGSGKTTTVGIIIGSISPTFGTITVEEFDVGTEKEKVRQIIGFCPERTVVFNELTVIEHLFFIARLRGLTKSQAQQQAQDLIHKLEMGLQRNVKVVKLSPGHKRLVTLMMSFCGWPRVIILDEPTLDMDSSLKKRAWNFLLNQKFERTLFVSTSIMEEADRLGDRIAIINRGELVCCGSSYFLKRKYGVGYHMTLTKQAGCDTDLITSLLRKYLPNLQISKNSPDYLLYLLPSSESEKFENMFSDLETNMESLKISRYGISITSLEEIFLKVGATVDTPEELLKEKFKMAADKRFNLERRNLASGPELVINQFLATFLKLYYSKKRTWLILLVQYMLPISWILVHGSQQKTTLSDQPSLTLTLKGQQEILINGDPSVSKELQDFVDEYEKVPHQRILLRHVRNISVELIEVMKEVDNRIKHTVALSISEEKIVAWFNGDMYHASAVSLGMVLDAIYKNYGYKVERNELSITFVNEPISFSQLEINENERRHGLSPEGVLGSTIVLGISISICISTPYYIRERASKFKYQQFISGLKRSVFWSTAFIFEWLILFVPLLLCVGAMAILKEDCWRDKNVIGTVVICLVCFLTSAVSLMFLVASLVSAPVTGFLIMFTLGFFSAHLIPYFFKVILPKLSHFEKNLNAFLKVSPFYGIFDVLQDLVVMHFYSEKCKRLISLCISSDLPQEECEKRTCDLEEMCCSLSGNYFQLTEPGVGSHVIYFIITSIIFFGLVICIDLRILRNFSEKFGKSRNYDTIDETDMDDDVVEHMHEIKYTEDHILRRNYFIITQNLTKYFGRKPALKNIYLGVRRHELFAVLGTTAAGKTTLFQILTGDVNITCGEAWVSRLNVQTQQVTIRNIIGYCPQWHSLPDYLTVRDTLKIFFLIRGIPRRECGPMIQDLADFLDFSKEMYRTIKVLSKGTKRKISIAVALVGNPPILFLDDTTAGLDSESKISIWNILNRLKAHGKCILLGTHNIEECEVLCDRMAILVNGQFACMGSISQLKLKFASGVFINIKIWPYATELDISLIMKFVEEKFENAELKEKEHNLLYFYIHNTLLPWSQMFGIMERGKSTLCVQEYSLGQCSLEQVYLSFTKTQK